VDFALLGFVEFLDLCSSRVGSLAVHSRHAAHAELQTLRAHAIAYRDAARQWAREARDVTRVVAGEDSPAFEVWSAALDPARGCWPVEPAKGSALPPMEDPGFWSGLLQPSMATFGPPFARRWVDAGLLSTPLAKMAGWDV